ncbi:MAG: hypothetical protein AA908_07405 [Chlorobi bacterium NICIL-2]|nr:MAG: hypothetical protein AA908_07405 [Chlorobi bacterium NICIL-2]
MDGAHAPRACAPRPLVGFAAVDFNRAEPSTTECSFAMAHHRGANACMPLGGNSVRWFSRAVG